MIYYRALFTSWLVLKGLFEKCCETRCRVTAQAQRFKGLCRYGELSMVRKQSKPLLTVAEIFNKVQEGVSGHSKYAKLLWDVHEANPSLCWRDFAYCLEHLLTLPQARRIPP